MLQFWFGSTRVDWAGVLCIACVWLLLPIADVVAQGAVATTTINLSICGDALVNEGEECDVPGETGVYSTTIAGRQCTAQCLYGPYCGDAILQTIFGEECDDGNNTSGDFCSATCQIEPPASGGGGGGSSGGGSSSRGGDPEDLGDTQINIEGEGYPGQRVNILLDGEDVGSVIADSDGEFDFALAASPGAATLGFWSLDDDGNRSITFSTTFDVTQGAITNISGILIPPTITADSTEVDPGDIITFSGQTIPNTTVELHINNSEIVETTSSDASGLWSVAFDTSRVSVSNHIAKPRFIKSACSANTESSFGSSLAFFVGVEGFESTPSDLNRDGSVNLIDFSILIFWWQTNGGDSDPPADINGNGNVSLEDFSILLFNWTG